jgi:hypothetical protein
VKQWRVYKRGDIYRVGHEYRTFFGRIKIQWFGTCLPYSDYFVPNDYASLLAAKATVQQLRAQENKHSAFDSDSWKEVL